MSTSSEFPVGAYFYPQTATCAVRAERIQSLGREEVDETLLVQEAAPLFAGHRQPHTYCLGDAARTRWDDADSIAMGLQVELMQDAGLEFVIFDTYGGSKNGCPPTREMDKPHDAFLALDDTRKNMQFATMWCRSGPRVDLPTPLGQDRRREAGRDYDQSVQTAKFIVDQCAIRYWNDPGHFRIMDRPYLSIYNTFSPAEEETCTELEKFMGTLKGYAATAYGVDPYIVAVERQTGKTAAISGSSIDAISAYAFLPDFTRNAPPLQDYTKRVEAVTKDWETIFEATSVPFVPPAVVGWDASPRGMKGVSLEEVANKYPYTPVLVDGSPDAFADMLSRSFRWTREHIPSREQYGLICSWNEIGEGCTLLPEVVDGKADFAYLDAMAKAISNFRASSQIL